MSATTNAPTIIKRKKVAGGDGHHGGAWKVAYADFVTAMMAFFLLMWLLNATTETQRKGIADYFNPTIPVNRISGGGDGAFGGDSVFAEESLAQSGTGASLQNPSSARQAKGTDGVDPEGKDSGEEAQAFAKVEEILSARAGESMVSELLQRHIVTRVTDEGLIVELHDLDGAPLFQPGTDEPTPVLRDLVSVLTEVFSLLPNGIAINGHTAANPVVVRQDPGWSLSTARAHRTREIFAEQGLDESRIERVTGFADRKLATRNPMAARNNRVEVILLRGRR